MNRFGRRGNRDWEYLLGDKDTGSGWVKVLGINTVDLVTQAQVGVVLTQSEGVLIILSNGVVQALHVGNRHRTVG